MQFIPIKTRIFNPPQDDIFDLLRFSIQTLNDGDIVCIASKIVSIHQGRCISMENQSKEELIIQESDRYIIARKRNNKDLYLSLKNNIIIPSAGIDENNSNGYYVLRPDNLSTIVAQIYDMLCNHFQCDKLGIVITDSTSRPLKHGVVGIALYSYGFFPLIDKRGSLDLFGKPLEITQINIADALAASAVYTMGEADECQPIVIIQDAPHITYTTDDVYEKIMISPKDDLYYPMLKPLCG